MAHISLFLILHNTPNLQGCRIIFARLQSRGNSGQEGGGGKVLGGLQVWVPRDCECERVCECNGGVWGTFSC